MCGQNDVPLRMCFRILSNGFQKSRSAVQQSNCKLAAQQTTFNNQCIIEQRTKTTFKLPNEFTSGRRSRVGAGRGSGLDCGGEAGGAVRAAGEAGSRREEAAGGTCTPRAPGRRYAAGPSGSRAQHARASGTRARRASTRAAGARAAGIRRSLGLPEVQLGQGRQPVGRRNRGDRWGAGITRAAGGRTAEEVGRARQGGG